jgi:hypothetical protein
LDCPPSKNNSSEEYFFLGGIVLFLDLLVPKPNKPRLRAKNAASPRFWRRLAEERRKKEERERSFSKVAYMPPGETIASPTKFFAFLCCIPFIFSE